MRVSASIICLAVTLAAAPAFAQGKASASPVSGDLARQAPAGFTFGLGLSNDESERTLLPVAPIRKDKLALSWKPSSNWDVTLDLTSRSQNQIFAREEVTAGVSYQVTPRFRLGGGLTVKGDSLTASLSNPADIARNPSTDASVRIESAFSF